MMQTVISHVAPSHVRKLITPDRFGFRKDVEAGDLAIKIVNAQLANQMSRRNVARPRVDPSAGRVPSLVDATANKLSQFLSEGREGDIKHTKELPPNVRNRVALGVTNIPYNILCEMREAGQEENERDEWVIRNEVWLRDLSVSEEPQSTVPTKRSREAKDESTEKETEKSQWKLGIVQFSAHAGTIFPGSELTSTCRIITRPTSLPGFKILDGRLSPKVRIQPSVEMFAKTFEAMTDGLLKNLDWDHVFVAGGVVLGALLCTEDKESTNTTKQWESSDIDLYIYGLGPLEANKKIEEIFETFKKNLPKDSPVLVVRNSKTITFYSNYPLRRVQIVLKLVNSPKDVLLNFDLDICALGWDGRELWMLPRAARALETGYTVFTMDLINGHYLGDRRATQEQRVFKYADKGYGIRILPSYLEEFQEVQNDSEKQSAIGIFPHSKDTPFWHKKLWDLRSFEDIVDHARKWTDNAVKEVIAAAFGTPVITHADMQQRMQTSEDPQGRSALSNLNLFMRHVALWERGLVGDVNIKHDVWAATTYDSVYPEKFGVGYNDAPDYPWDQNFTMDGFVSNLHEFNKNEQKQLAANFYPREYGNINSNRIQFASEMDDGDIEGLFSDFLKDGTLVQRITHAPSVEGILQPDCDIYLSVWLPKTFVDFAETLILESVRNSGIPDYTIKPFTDPLREGVHYKRAEDEGLQLVIWRITNTTMWQQLSRPIDEVHEVLWSFHHAYASFMVQKDDRLGLLISHFAKRAIRVTTQDEFDAFARWVARRPAPFSPYHGEFNYGDSDYEEEEGEED